jgi:hypothetical protein
VRLAASDHPRVPAIAWPLLGIRTSWCHPETGVAPGAAGHSVSLELVELGWIEDLAVRGPREGPPLQFAEVGDLQGDPVGTTPGDNGEELTPWTVPALQ